MRLREYTILKFLPIILFTVELLAPSVLSSFLMSEYLTQNKQGSFLAAGSQGSVLVFLLEEQVSEEGRGREDAMIPFHLNYLGEYFATVKKESLHFSSITQKEIFEVHPPLFKLNCSFLI